METMKEKKFNKEQIQLLNKALNQSELTYLKSYAIEEWLIKKVNRLLEQLKTLSNKYRKNTYNCELSTEEYKKYYEQFIELATDLERYANLSLTKLTGIQEFLNKRLVLSELKKVNS